MSGRNRGGSNAVGRHGLFNGTSLLVFSMLVAPRRQVDGGSRRRMSRYGKQRVVALSLMRNVAARGTWKEEARMCTDPRLITRSPVRPRR